MDDHVAEVRERYPLRLNPKPRYWYFLTINCCPICGRDDTSRERRFDPRPDDPTERRDFREVWDYCDAF